MKNTASKMIKNFVWIFFPLLMAVANNQAFAANKITFYHYDLLGSSVATTNELGEVVWREEYSPYGDKLLKQDVGKDNVRGYTGHVHDEETGLTYMQARYYDAEIGRFMGVDPVGFMSDNTISFNRYAYGNDNPYKFVDPNGESGVEGSEADREKENSGLSKGEEIAVNNLEQWVKDYRKERNEGMQNTGNFIQGLKEALGLVSVGSVIKNVPKSGPLWSSTKIKSAVENALGHWNKHKSEFPEFQNAKQYAEGTKDFLTNPPKGTLTKTNNRGDTLRYDPNTNTFGVLSENGAPRTMFRPKDGMDYWNRQ